MCPRSANMPAELKPLAFCLRPVSEPEDAIYALSGFSSALDMVTAGSV